MGVVRGPAQAPQVFQIRLVGARVGHGLDALALVVLHHAHPAQRIAADLHGHAAHGVQQLGLGARAYQGFAAGAAHALRAVQAGQLALDAAAPGHVVGQHLPGIVAAEGSAAHEQLHLDGRAVLAHVFGQDGPGGRGGCRLHGRGGLAALVRGPEAAQVHAAQLVFAIAVVLGHSAVRGQQAQAAALADPHGLRVLGEQCAVLQLGRAQLRIRVPQLDQGAQRFGQDAQMRQVARRKFLPRCRRHVQQARQRGMAAQGCGDEAPTVLHAGHMVVRQPVAALRGRLGQPLPQRVLAQRADAVQRRQRPPFPAHAGVHAQHIAFAQLDHRGLGARKVAGGLRSLLQHLRQRLLQARDLLLHAQQAGMGVGLLLRLQLDLLARADVGHAADHAPAAPLGVAQHEAAVAHPGVAAVLAAEAVFVAPVLARALDHAVQAREHALRVLGVQPLGPGTAVGRQALQRHAEQRLHALVPPHGVVHQVPVPDGVGRGAGHEVEALVALAHVAHRAVQGGDAPRPVAHRLSREPYRHGCAARQQRLAQQVQRRAVERCLAQRALHLRARLGREPQGGFFQGMPALLPAEQRGRLRRPPEPALLHVQMPAARAGHARHRVQKVRLRVRRSGGRLA
jgi:hypothetical protein